MSRLADQIKQVLPVFSALETPPALIGGLALAAHRKDWDSRESEISYKPSG